jgi:integrase
MKKIKVIKHKEMADRIAEHINAKIDEKRAAYDPRQDFRTPGHEFQFNLYAERWLTENQFSYAPSERRHVSRYCQLAIDYFKNTDMREIRKADLKELVKTFPSKWNSKTSRNALGVLHKVLADALDDELLEKLPGFPDLEIVEPEVKWITREWQEKIIAAIPERDRPIFEFMATWGVRPGEARALQWEDVDFEKEIITIKRTFSGAGCNNLQTHTKTRRRKTFILRKDWK